MRVALLLLVVGLLGGCSDSVSSSVWPQFRGAGGLGHADAVLPTEWSNTENVTWRRELPGVGWSSPVLYRGIVYVTTAVETSEAIELSEEEEAERNLAGEEGDKIDRDLRVIGLDAKSGKVLFETTVFAQDGETAPFINEKNSHASPTVVVDGEKIYAHFGHQGVACLSLKGKVLWERRDYAFVPRNGNGGSPVITGDALIFSCDGQFEAFVLALDKNTGETLWRTVRDNAGVKNSFSFSTPLVVEVAGEMQVVSQASEVVFAYDPKNGETLWRVNYPRGYSVIPRPVYAHGLVYVCTGYASADLMAIDPTGTGDITKTHVQWIATKGVPMAPSPIVVGDELYMITDNGIIYCLDVKTGDEIWKSRVGGAHSASPLHANGLIYFQSEEGETIIIKAGKKFEEVGRNELGERSLASFGVDEEEGALFIRTEQAVYRVE